MLQRDDENRSHNSLEGPTPKEFAIMDRRCRGLDFPGSVIDAKSHSGDSQRFERRPAVTTVVELS
jgi:hypothetical protein